MGRFSGVLLEETKSVIHINGKATGDSNIFLLGNLNGLSKAMVHPDLCHDDHERETDRARIRSRVMSVKVNEVGGGEAEVYQVNKIARGEGGTGREGRVFVEEFFNDFYAFF